MSNFKILITSPSIDPQINVSGIANLTRMLIENNTEVNYYLFTAGKKDNEARKVKWFFKQIKVLLSFKKQVNDKTITMVHINMPLEKAAIVRDTSFAALCHVVNKPYIIHLRGGSYSKNVKIPWIFNALIKKSLKKANKIIVLGNEEKKFVNDFYNIENRKIIVLSNCVKIPEFKQKEIHKIDKINILFLGRIDKNKGLKEIINALSSISPDIDYIFNIAGDGPDKDWFLELCKKNIAKKFSYRGVVYGESKEHLLAESHIFLLPSYFEGLPNALLEAMSYGVVPIVTPVGSIPEVVEHKKNGLIVKIKNSNDIKNAIGFLFHNKGIYKRLSQQAYHTIAVNYSLDNYLKELNKIYQNI